jgi:hypothetical protein
MAFKSKMLDTLYWLGLREKNELVIAHTSLEIGSKSDFNNNENPLSHNESKALWIKINQTLQIIH